MDIERLLNLALQMFGDVENTRRAIVDNVENNVNNLKSCFTHHFLKNRCHAGVSRIFQQSGCLTRTHAARLKMSGISMILSHMTARFLCNMS